nr:mucin-5AC-like [Cherax quadricarinatus]
MLEGLVTNLHTKITPYDMFVSEVCAGSRVLGSQGHGGEYFNTNTLAEVERPSPLDYESLLERIHGDFGARSDMEDQHEPEYEGSETLVVPLYIPEGAVPINLARIARSGSPQGVVELVNMKVSPSADSVLIRRIGPVGGRPSLPRRSGWRPPQRTRLTRLPLIRRSDQMDETSVARPPPPPFLLAEFGQRLPAANTAPLVAVRRVSLSHALPDELDDMSSTRAKKNEFSKDSQFLEEFHTTSVPENEALDTSSEANVSTPTTKTVPTTTQSDDKGPLASKLMKSPLSSTTTTTAASIATTHTTTVTSKMESATTVTIVGPSPTSTTSPSTTTPTTTAPTSATPTTTPPTTATPTTAPTTATPTTTAPTLATPTTTAPTTATPTTTAPTTATPTTTAPTTATSTTTAPTTATVPTTATAPTTTTLTTTAPTTTTHTIMETMTTNNPTTREEEDIPSTMTNTPPTTKWDRRSVLFPRPVESILKLTKIKTLVTTPTTTTTPASTTTAVVARSPVPLRSLPLWVSRSKLSPITSTPTSAHSPVIEKVTLFTRLPSTTKRPFIPTTEVIELLSSTKAAIIKEASHTIPVTRRPLRVSVRPVLLTINQTITSTNTTDTTKSPHVSQRPVVVVDPERPLPVRMMQSVSEILRDIAVPKQIDDTVFTEKKEDSVLTEKKEESSAENPSLSFFTTKSPRTEERDNKLTSESSIVLKVNSDFQNATEKGQTNQSPTRLMEVDKDQDSEETTTKEIEHKPTITGLRKHTRIPRPTTRSGHRRRRPLRQRVTIPPPITHAKDFFIAPEETLVFISATEEQKITITTTSTTFPPIIVSTTLPPPILTTEKSPEQIVIESLTEIMKDATNNNKSKDKVSSIATNLEALNKQLAERGIHIIHAEVDGVKIKLDNRTITRPILQPLATTFRPSTFYNMSSVTDFTERTSSSTVSTEREKEIHVTADSVTDEKPEKQIHTSVKSSFSFHTTKATEIEETDNDNEVQSTTNDSSFTTTKPVDTRKFSDKPGWSEAQKPALSSSLLPYAEETEDPARNKTQIDGFSKTPAVDESSVQTSSPRGDRDKELSDGVTLKSIFATSTVPSSVTTRTRSTTVPITTHRPATTPFLFSPRGRTRPEHINREESVAHVTSEIENEDLSVEATNTNSTNKSSSLAPQEPHIFTSIHPTSHQRPAFLPPHKKETVRIFGSGASISGVSQDTASTKSTHVDSASIVKTTITTRTTTLRPIIEVIAFAPGSAVASENTEGEGFSESSSPSSYTAVYIIGVIGIIPAAALTAFLAKKFLKKTQKALPESEERGEGFTPITHPSRKTSNSNTFEADGSSVEAKNPHPKYTPWEFPRSKLRLVSILGEGNFGVVWKAEARELCACEGVPGGPTVLVAVKGVKEGAGTKERQDLLKELAIMQHIGQHPNVVTLLGCCTQQEPHYVIMEYVMFGKLLTFLRDHRTRHNYFNFSSDTEALTSRDLTRFACQVATGCEYLQSRGIIHRDLASRNILVDHTKVCKIADFGLARNVKDLGTDIYEQKSRGALPIRWMAPESLYMSIFTHKSDVWSFGILCWEIVTLGSTPYPGMTAREVMRSVREGYRLDRPDHCHPELYRIVTKCWHQDLNKRPSFSEVKVDLAQLLDHGQTGYIDLENFPEGSYYSMHENNDERL